MEKLYDRIDFQNNTSPALNETNLNLMSKAIDDIDDRVVGIAGTVMETVPQIQENLEEAQDLLEDAEAISTHPPIIGQNGNWWTWDTTIEDYADSGIDAGVSLEIGETTTLAPGEDATVENVGTATDPILNFGIPAGVAGQDGQDGDDGADGVSPTVTIGTITGGHSVMITDADHPTGQSFNVMDGQDGAPGVGVPSGGTTGQVLAKASGTDYDTEWVNASGGSGGHTILDGSGTAMAQRTNLQFVGATVSDDSANDATVVTIEGTSGSGQRYLEQTITTSTSMSVTATFTDAAITSTTALQVVTTNGISSSAVTTTGQTVVTIPPQPSASQIKVRLYFLDIAGTPVIPAEGTFENPMVLKSGQTFTIYDAVTSPNNLTPLYFKADYIPSIKIVTSGFYKAPTSGHNENRFGIFGVNEDGTWITPYKLFIAEENQRGEINQTLSFTTSTDKAPMYVVWYQRSLQYNTAYTVNLTVN